ncbi:MAG: ABC transporter permease [Nocardioides sp.]|uniref:ABC transporter permease n=1 Tax=Nocardioides sp. TaxID=35761 RepID=UPI0039E628D2
MSTTDRAHPGTRPGNGTTEPKEADAMAQPTEPVTTETATETAVVHRSRPSAHSLLGFAERYALLGLVIAIFVVFAVMPSTSSTFTSMNNIATVLRGQTAVGMIAIAAVFPLVTGNIDFSLGATSSASMVLSAGMMANHNIPWVPCAIASLVFGAIVGTFNGVMVTRFKLDAFVTTLGVATLLGGLITWYTGGQTIYNNISTTLTDFSYAKILGIPEVTVMVIVIAAIAWYLLSHTPFGRSLYAIGSNPTSARLVGLPVQRNVMLTFVISGTVAGAAGLLRLAVVGSGQSDNGTSLLFPALAAVFLGATAFRPGFFNILGTMVGVLLVAFSVSGLTQAGVNSAVQDVFNGAALLVAVGFSTYLGVKRRSRG